jgi:hypothetical protein
MMWEKFSAHVDMATVRRAYNPQFQQRKQTTDKKLHTWPPNINRKPTIIHFKITFDLRKIRASIQNSARLKRNAAV